MSSRELALPIPAQAEMKHDPTKRRMRHQRVFAGVATTGALWVESGIASSVEHVARESFKSDWIVKAFQSIQKVRGHTNPYESWLSSRVPLVTPKRRATVPSPRP